MKRWLMPLLLVALICTFVSQAPQAAAQEQELVIYFTNWAVHTSDNGQVKNLPWDRVSYINHAFWKIVPDGEGYAIASTDTAADLTNSKAHFKQYEEYTAKYPNVNVMLSIGGWTRCGYFSAMALTAETRKSFIDSCIKTLKQYPWLAGIDIDWEYPGVARSGGTGDEGNPVKGKDKTNYTLLLKEMRAALDQEFGAGVKKLSICASSAIGTLTKQDYAALHPYVDLINIMSYDMTGSYEKTTGHHSALYSQGSLTTSAANAAQYMVQKGVPAEKICIGSPLYCHGWKNVTLQDKMVGAAASGANTGGDMNWSALQKFENAAVAVGTPGWHVGYDEFAQAAYLWNDDPSSSYYKNFLTYESIRSLDAKIAYILDNALAGLIVWQVGGDNVAAGYPMITRMAEGLGIRK